MSHYKLSASLKGHEEDVRGVSFAGSDTIISASRDATVRRWQRKTSSPPTYDNTIVSHGESYITAVTYAPPFSDFTDGLYISGGKDTIIDVRQVGRPPDQDAERLLLGHEGNVCSLDFSKDPKTPYLISGSWDCSARLWNITKGQSVATLDGHQGSVWAVLAYDKEFVITGCADHQIRVFTTRGELVNTIKGPTDVVRALCKLPPDNTFSAHFASAGNDSVIRIWTLDGQEKVQLHGHENFIYSLAALPSGELVSTSEDRTARIWRGTDCVQTITHPAISVWTVAADSETGDIVTGASDRMIRVFSRDTSRHAAPEEVKSFEESVASSAIPQQQMPQINKSQLPGPDFLQRKSGTKDGQVQMIAEPNGTISAHSWSASSQSWVAIGSVVDSAGSSGRKHNYMGQDYDYVFDVDIEDGKPPLKLPYNLNQNPHEAAQKFLADNHLPASYIEETTKFIINNTQGASLGSGETSTPSHLSTPSITQQRQTVLPQKDYLSITAASLPTIQSKIEQLNQQLLSAGSKDIALAPAEIKHLPEIFANLAQPSSSSSNSPYLESGARYAIKICMSWPPSHKIPGLDMLRCLAATPAATTLVGYSDIFKVLDTSGAFEADANPNFTMLAVRTLVNLFTQKSGREYFLAHISELIEHIAPLVRVESGAGNRNILIAACTVYINIAVIVGEKADPTVLNALASDILGLLANKKIVDGEVLYRALVAIGTLVYNDSAADKTLSSSTKREEIIQAAKLTGQKTKEPRTKSLVSEILQKLEKP